MNRIMLFLAGMGLLLGSAVTGQEPKHSYVPRGGYVANADTAVKIAVAVWSPIYEVRRIQAERPFHAHLQAGVWFVKSSLRRGRHGGVAVAEIAKRDGRILRVSHGK